MARTDAQLADGFNPGEASRCNACSQFIGMRPWLPPFRVELDTWGNEFGDLAFLSVGTDVLISLRFKQLWERQLLVGLSGFEPVEIVKVRRHGKAAGDPPPYFRAVIPRSQTTVDFVASEFEWNDVPSCPVCYLGDIKRWKRVVIDRSTWAQEDIFVARGLPGEFITSERFQEFCKANDLRNATLVPAEAYGHDFYPWERESQSANAVNRHE